MIEIVELAVISQLVLSQADADGLSLAELPPGREMTP
jgi:hypothetical protein